MTEGRWPASTICAVMLVGIVGVLIAGLQPQLLGALATEGRLTTNQLGVTATIELLAMGLAAGGTGLLIKPVRLRAIAVAATIIIASTDLLTPSLTGSGIMAARTIAGLASGVLIWITIGLIARTAVPERWAGIYLMTQTLAQLAVATVLAGAIPAVGARGGFGALGTISLIALLCVPFLPSAYPPLERDGDTTSLPPRAGLAALAGVLIYLAFVVALWVYLEPLATENGIDAATVARAVPIGLAAQVAGALLATLLVGRIRALWVVLAVAAANIALLALFGSGPAAVVFLAATGAFGLLWMFVMPFQLELVINADPSRRAATLIGGAQLIGSSLGPLLASLVVDDRHVGAILWLGAACILVSTATMLAALRYRARA
jgi:predicted MFS family arabinose efflux permease